MTSLLNVAFDETSPKKRCSKSASMELLSNSFFIETWTDHEQKVKKTNIQTTTDDRNTQLMSSRPIYKNKQKRLVGTTIVLNYQKLIKLCQKKSELSVDCTFFRDKYEHESTNINQELKPMLLSLSSSSSLKVFGRRKAAICIQRIWKKFFRKCRRHQDSIRLLRYLQYTYWSEAQSNSVFSLVLGWRIRKLFRSLPFQKCIRDLNETYEVLIQIVNIQYSKPSSTIYKNPNKLSEHIRHRRNLLLSDVMLSIKRNFTEKSGPLPRFQKLSKSGNIGAFDYTFGSYTDQLLAERYTFFM